MPPGVAVIAVVGAKQRAVGRDMTCRCPHLLAVITHPVTPSRPWPRRRGFSIVGRVRAVVAAAVRPKSVMRYFPVIEPRSSPSGLRGRSGLRACSHQRQIAEMECSLCSRCAGRARGAKCSRITASRRLEPSCRHSDSACEEQMPGAVGEFFTPALAGTSH